MKKIISMIIAGFMLSSSAFAADNFYTYNKFIYNNIYPESGVCDINASFIGHEVEYTDINAYFSGLISAFNVDLDADGNDELVTVESKALNVYTANGKDVIFCDDEKTELIGNSGDSYSNVFVKTSGNNKYLGIETFFANSAQNCYQLKIFGLDSETKTLTDKVDIYQMHGLDGEVFQSVLKDGVTIYTHTESGGIITSSDPEKFESVYMAAKNALENVGITEQFIDRPDRMKYDSSQYGNAHRLSDYVHEMEVMSYITATGIRNTPYPLVIFETKGNLQNYIQECFTINVLVNGVQVEFVEQDPIIVNDRTLVPVRAIFEALGAEVSWLPSSMKVVSNTDTTNVTMTIGEDVYYVNGEKRYLDVPPMVLNDRTVVPVRAVAESFGCNVDWNDETKTVIINSN